MGIFRRRQAQHSNTHTLPGDIVRMMERFGRFEFNQPGSGGNAGEIWQQTQAPLLPFASADPDGFLVALERAVLPVGGWAVCGAARTISNVMSHSEAIRHHPSYNAIMNASLAFLRSIGVGSGSLTGYEWTHWVASGGTHETWLPQLPTPSPEDAPITALQPGESRRVAQMTSQPDSNVILVRQVGEGRYGALIEAKQSDEDSRRDPILWLTSGSLYDLYIAIGRSFQRPPHWCDRELEPYFPLPRPRI